jgi:hypothetical protein
MAGAGKRVNAAAAPAAEPAKSVRRLTLRAVIVRDISVSLSRQVAAEAHRLLLPLHRCATEFRSCHPMSRHPRKVAIVRDRPIFPYLPSVLSRSAAEIQAGDVVGYFRRTIAQIVLLERPAAGRPVLKIQPPASNQQMHPIGKCYESFWKIFSCCGQLTICHLSNVQPARGHCESQRSVAHVHLNRSPIPRTQS